MKKLILMISLLLIGYADSASIHGHIFNDFNGDSNLENEIINNLTSLSLYDVNELKETSINVDGEGYYTIDINPGSYILVQKLNNEIPTYPELGFYYILIKDENEVHEKTFGNFKLGNIYGYVFNENNEKLFKIRVYLSNGFSYLTNEEGYYEFSNLDQGNYSIVIGENILDNIVINSGTIAENNFTLKYYAQEININKNISWFEKILSEII